ncbi:MAG TPA: hypothetical protein VGK70_11420 [Thermoanaerobaculia bacterium]|jgi:hypothetical protein
MGEVYRARDPRLSREVAIKVLPLRREALAQGQTCDEMHADYLLLPLWSEPAFQELLKPKA